jgi:AraC-like DNA-binding protein/CheY-like chemotaxis protein
LKKKLIIIVGDDPLVAIFLKTTLEEVGFEVLNDFISIEHSIELIKEKNPVLVFIDVKLNKTESGIDIGYFLFTYDKIPYVYITSSTDKTSIKRIIDTKPNGYFLKPLNSIDIVLKINIILNNYNYRNNEKTLFISNNYGLVDDIPFIINKTIQYINNNIYKTITINELALQTRWEKHHFLRMFTKYVGTTPYKYILQQKIIKAKCILIETNFKIIVIAFDLGFNSHASFSVRFKKITGFTPEVYRKIHKSKIWLNN